MEDPGRILMELKEIMNTNVLVTNKGTSVLDAVQLMIEYRVNNVLVLDADSAVGIITETDILKKVVAPQKDAEILKVEDIMSHPLITAPPDMTIESGCNLMAENKLKKLPIIDKRRLVGIVTATDIIANEPKHMAQLAELILKPTEIVGG